MDAKFFAGTQAQALGRELASLLGVHLSRSSVERFPDGELEALLEEDVENQQVVLVQPLLQPAGESLLELRLLADACLRAGASRLSAVVPYFAYARQDRRTHRLQALGGVVMARLVSEGLARIVAVDLHAEAAEGWFCAPLEHLSAIPALAEAVRPGAAGAVVVSPDLGGAKRASKLAQLLGLEVAIVDKTRKSGSSVATRRVLGLVRDRRIILVDDMISTGATIEAAIGALRAERCAADFTVVVTHALLVDRAIERLAASQIQRLVHTDTVPVRAKLPFPHQEVSVAPIIAGAFVPSDQLR